MSAAPDADRAESAEGRNGMSVSKLVAFLRALPENQREDMIERMQPEEQAIIRSLLISSRDSNASTVDEIAREMADDTVRRR